MSPTRHNCIPRMAATVLYLVVLSLVAVFAFSQGKASAERRAEVQVANDDAFYSLYALKALKDPQNEKWRTLFQASLDGSAIKLSEMCMSCPGLIGNTNYNLLIGVQKYLKQYGHDSDRDPALRPVDQVMAKIAEATTKMETIHQDVGQWEDEESSRTYSPATSK